MTSAHPRHRLDPVVHSPIRLSVLAVLAEVDEAEFRLVAETVDVNSATLSKQATILEDAGLIRIRKGNVGRRPRTWLALTGQGRQRFTEYLEALRAITDSVTR
jgi:DNA-binding MarR family transcriptional regulator